LFFGWDAKLRGTLLEFHRIDACQQGGIYQAFCRLNITVVVDANLRDDICWMPVTYDAITKLDFSWH
jgi:hypothetical protein